MASFIPSTPARLLPSAPSRALRRRPRRRAHATLSPPSPAASPLPAPLPSPRPRAPIDEITSVASLERLILADGGSLLVVEAHSRSCRACIGMQRAYERVADAYAGRARFARVSADDVPAMHKHLGIRAMPLFVLYKKGGRIDHFAGASRQRLEELIEDNA